MPEPIKPQPGERTTIASLKGGPDFQAWFNRFQKQLRLPAALLIDAALAEFAKAKGFEEPPPR
jgi:hypothetical protein